jgi:hypothetical protein
MTRAWLLVLLAAGAPSAAFAQDSPDMVFEEGDEAGTDTPPPVEGQPATPPGADDELPRILFVPEPRTPRELVREVAEVLDTVGQAADTDAYVRDARARGLRPDSEEAFDPLLAAQNVALVIVVGRTEDRNRVHLIYREGRLGFALLEEEHDLAGRDIPPEVANRILAEARLALAAVTRPAEGGPVAAPVPMERAEDRRRPDRAEVGTAVHVGVSAGLGMGTRSFELDTDAGGLRLATDPFPAAVLSLRIQIEPEARGQLELEGTVRYLTSVGLRTTDQRTALETASRAQRLELDAAGRLRLGASQSALALEAALGWALRSFSSEAPVSLPDYLLGGPYARIGVILPLMEGRLRLVVSGEAQLIVTIGDDLAEAGGQAPGVALGYEGTLRYQLTDAISLAALYRESYASFENVRGGAAGDFERFAAITITYRP